MSEKREYLTKEKHLELQKELDYLKKTKRREIADNLEYAKSMGDLAENAEYQEAREQQSEVEERVEKLELILAHAEILPEHHGGNIGIGAKIVLEKMSDKSEKTYHIVGSEEANLTLGKISIESPLGRALIGKKKGETFEFSTPGGKVSYKVVDVK
ncbi:MAG: transcription elongation factor GreA [Candidatus Paceibacterota bacterium]